MTPTSHIIQPSGESPNSPLLPVLRYRHAFAGDRTSASAIEDRFTGNGWGGTWRDGLYAFHHYHSRGHEALGVCSGWVRIQLGGDGGQTVRLDAGDAVVLPAGVAHKKIGASSDEERTRHDRFQPPPVPQDLNPCGLRARVPVRLARRAP